MKADRHLYERWTEVAFSLIDEEPWNDEMERKVTFECPICKDEAFLLEYKSHGSRSEADKVDIRGGCKGCNISVAS